MQKVKKGRDKAAVCVPDTHHFYILPFPFYILFFPFKAIVKASVGFPQLCI